MNWRPMIKSAQNQRIKDAVKLRDRRGRTKQNRFTIDGFRELHQALEAGIVPTEAFVYGPLAESKDAKEIVARLESMKTPISPVDTQVWEKLAYGARKEGIVAIATHAANKADQLPVLDGTIVVLDKVEKPGNVGAILRTADATGVAALALADPGTDLFNPNIIRASLGAVFCVPVYVDSAENWLRIILEREIPLFVSRVDAQLEHFAADLSGTHAVVFGSEADGVRDLWNVQESTGIRLPMAGVVDSLNVSATAAAVLYEGVRQRALAKSLPTD